MLRPSSLYLALSREELTTHDEIALSAALSCKLWVCTVNRFSLHPWSVAWRPLVSAHPAQFLCPGVLVNSGRLTLTGKRGGVCKDNWLRPSTVAEAFARAGAAVVGSSLELFQYISCLTVRLLEKHLRPGSESGQNKPWKCWVGGKKLRFLQPKSTLQLPVSQPFVHKRVNAQGMTSADCFRSGFEPVSFVKSNIRSSRWRFKSVSLALNLVLQDYIISTVGSKCLRI